MKFPRKLVPETREDTRGCCRETKKRNWAGWRRGYMYTADSARDGQNLSVSRRPASLPKRDGARQVLHRTPVAVAHQPHHGGCTHRPGWPRGHLRSRRLHGRGKHLASCVGLLLLLIAALCHLPHRSKLVPSGRRRRRRRRRRALRSVRLRRRLPRRRPPPPGGKRPALL